MKEVSVRQFFIKRFERSPETDKQYYKEWKQRFARGNPERWMDKKSKKVYRAMKRKK